MSKKYTDEFKEEAVRLASEGFRVDTDKLGVPSGKISFIRMVRSSLQIDVLGFKFTVAKPLSPGKE